MVGWRVCGAALGTADLDRTSRRAGQPERECRTNVTPDRLTCANTAAPGVCIENEEVTVISDGGIRGYGGRLRKNRGSETVRLAQRRKAMGLTQKQLAGQLGVERAMVARWERGQTQPLPWLRPTLASLQRHLSIC